MIFIVVKFLTADDHAEAWPDHVREFTEATRAEPGNLWFEWSRSLENPREYVLVEAFRDEEAGSAHVNSQHFAKAQRDLTPLLATTPKVVSERVGAAGWSELAEMSVPQL
ncbi:putative quinol monooxygenase [Segniliparus rugosus]|uniref:ABM domain-containing protein n=1 Tax=Segniliparus rugosus (strain ATCC BAA-974 / DSM 45345 / CCUG 50838 / CIP 108380 / JCM 13579 / CDC 945) TaxID=679197 RepID=E5XU87_SEGRC|nr:putative quinol monooxygenase [Segniliparus rugosus]EFV12086.1 hypothetical protein HMPREF9336_03059 [Segniliparus rugosus ATCC BAA-974]